MIFRNATAAIALLAATTLMAQGTPPGTASADKPIASQWRPVTGKGGTTTMSESARTAAQANAAMQQRLHDMQGTLDKMHALLKQLRARTGKSGAQDALAQANLDMWELMVGHLDKQFEQLRLATMTREDLEARRAAMYKQVDAKAAAAAQVARSLGAGQVPASAPAAQGAEQNTAPQTVTGQTSSAPPPTASPSPN
jgi:Skp family chaperone for outer membrane proteins